MAADDRCGFLRRKVERRISHRWQNGRVPDNLSILQSCKLSTDCCRGCGYVGVCGRMPGMANLTPHEDTQRRALDTILRTLDLTDGQHAVTVGLSRSTVRSHRRGEVRLRADQIAVHAEALGVPVDLFDQPATEVLVWLANNKRERVLAASGWLKQSTYERAA